MGNNANGSLLSSISCLPVQAGDGGGGETVKEIERQKRKGWGEINRTVV